jgi:hypothetical protein
MRNEDERTGPLSLGNSTARGDEGGRRRREEEKM